MSPCRASRVQLDHGVADGVELVAIGIGVRIVRVDDRPVAELHG